MQIIMQFYANDYAILFNFMQHHATLCNVMHYKMRKVQKKKGENHPCTCRACARARAWARARERVKKGEDEGEGARARVQAGARARALARALAEARQRYAVYASTPTAQQCYLSCFPSMCNRISESCLTEQT